MEVARLILKHENFSPLDKDTFQAYRRTPADGGIWGVPFPTAAPMMADGIWGADGGWTAADDGRAADGHGSGMGAAADRWGIASSPPRRQKSHWNASRPADGSQWG